MKKNKFIYIALVILIIIAAYFYFTNTSNTINDEKGAKSDFAIEDTASIDKIFMVDAKGQQITLTRTATTWKVNGKYNARPDNISLLLKTFKRIAVRYPVAKSAFNTVVKNIATGSTKVEIYQGKSSPSKIYYVGNSTMDQQGTYMLLETDGVKSTLPYATHIPGFRGFLNSRFFTNAQQWRDAVVFKYQPKEIKKIEVTYPETPKQSFTIINDEERISLFDYQNKELKKFNPKAVKRYIDNYKKVYYEMIDQESSKEKKDSIMTSKSYFTITVEDKKGKTNTITAYHMPNYRALLDKNGKQFPYDVDRMYAYLNDELFIFIQFATFNKITLPLKAFLIKK